MPFVNADLLRFIIAQLDADTDIVMGRDKAYPSSSLHRNLPSDVHPAHPRPA